MLVMCCIFSSGIHQANMAQALTWWGHLGDFHEMMDMLHWAMCFVPYPSSGMAIEITVEIPKF